MRQGLEHVDDPVLLHDVPLAQLERGRAQHCVVDSEARVVLLPRADLLRARLLPIYLGRVEEPRRLYVVLHADEVLVVDAVGRDRQAVALVRVPDYQVVAQLDAPPLPPVCPS